MRTVFYCRNRVLVAMNPEYEYRLRNLEPRRHIPAFIVYMPKIERYFFSLKRAIRYTKDKRRINGERRRGARHAREVGLEW